MIYRWEPRQGRTPRVSARSHCTRCMPSGVGSLTGSETPPAPSLHTPLPTEMPALALLPDGAVAPFFPLQACTTLHRALLCCGSQVLCVLQMEGLWQPHPEQVSWRQFSNNIRSLCVFVSHFVNSRNISKFSS